ncbi:MAG: FAD/NAD(P)-binding protein [Candidatus Marinimicrobia bacterium]|nr:FAD/NAD(P)-binding protein [Candidatus Neomarinimicrobiota bacterium]MCF7829969.1 FAD/NAD(P)-binding protein [Candidatus Neomarinimicrobiota bacterium]MCF7881877.1 FAD/NAD(P)-binding protein [Candidatus Neomarinimicrobiota bacterium]
MFPSNIYELESRAREDNPYLPQLGRIVRRVPMVEDNYLFLVRFDDPEIGDSFTYKPGQFMELSVIGTGESPISISSTPTRKGLLEFCVRRMGRNTNALYRLKDNDIIGLRGPYGNGFPVEEMEGSNLLLIAGGLGMAPLRSLLNYALDMRHKYERIILMYGSKYPEDILFRDELESLESREDIECLLTVEQAYDLPDAKPWHGKIGMVTDLFKEIDNIDIYNTYAVACGPPIFYKFVIQELLDRQFPKDKILMSLERRMECGIGKCGHCGIGYKYTCIDGPVFTYWDAMNLPEMID